MSNSITNRLRKNFLYELILRKIRPYTSARFNWNKVIKDTKLINPSKTKILIATSTGGLWPCSSFESLLAYALILRGASVKILLNDGIVDACQECESYWLSEKRFIEEGNKSICNTSFLKAKTMYDSLGIKVLKYSDYVYHSDSEIKINIDEHARAGALRYLGRGTLDGPIHNQIYKKYEKASELTKRVIDNLTNKYNFTSVVFHHGIYVPQGIIGDVCREKNIHVINWGPSYRKGTVLFSHNDTYHRTILNDDKNNWSQMKWCSEKNVKLMNYLNSRKTGVNDWISFQNKSDNNKDSIYSSLGIDQNKPIITLLTNVLWDAQLHFKGYIFKSMLDWLFYTIDYFKKNKKVQLVIRIHPGETLGTVPSKQSVYDEIIKKYKSVPKNIFIVKASNDMSTYNLIEISDSCIVYGTKMAIEISCIGKPVIVAGESWARNKGFTIDVDSIDEYKKQLDMLPYGTMLNNDLVVKAKKFAYYIFFQRMITLNSIKYTKYFSPFGLNITKTSELLPGNDKGLDLICEGILNKKEFIQDND